MKREEAEKILDCAQKYKYYISSDVFKNAMQMQRKIVVQFPDTVGVKFKWKVKQLQEVKKGDCIAETRVCSAFYSQKSDKNQRLKAPSAG